jgi:hypothetical protein
MSGAGGAPITSCPASTSAGTTAACSGTFTCQMNGLCTCHGCCFGLWSCVNGTFKQVDYNDGCFQGPTCPDGGADGQTGAICTPGADQSCNDNPALSSIHGHCTDAGACECGSYVQNPDSGRCL